MSPAAFCVQTRPSYARRQRNGSPHVHHPAHPPGHLRHGGRIEAARTIWREGFVAEALVRQAAVPTLGTSGERHACTLTAAGLAGWSVSYEAPVTYDWNGWTLAEAGGWSQGPAFLQQLALLPDDLPAHGSADYVHLLVEGCKLAMADREARYGDPATGILSAAANPRGMQGYAVGR